MENPLDIKLTGNSISELLQSYRVALRQQTDSDKHLLWRSFEAYIGLGGLAAILEKMNNRTIREIIKDTADMPDPPAIARGEVDGTSYALYENRPPER